MFAARERLNTARTQTERCVAVICGSSIAQVFEGDLARCARMVGGHVAMAALHLPSGQWLAVNGRSRVPLASIAKVVTAVHLLRRVDRAEVALDTRLVVERHDLRPGAGILAARSSSGAIEVSVRDLLELALTRSDNTAADMILRLAGGVDAVRAGLAERGSFDISIDRSMGELIADLSGVSATACTPAEWAKIVATASVEQRRAAMNRALEDPRDTCTPEGIVRFLAAVRDERVISRESTLVLLDSMARCKTGARRLKGLLPGVRVAHKTGSILSREPFGDRGPRLSADAGVVELPAGRGDFAVAAFVVDSPLAAREQDRAIARLARTAYDCFTVLA